jgi:FixJ family two-component response regulator
MPDVRGLGIQQALRCQGVVLPVIFMSAQQDVSLAVSAMQSGAADFLVKPVEPALLFAAIERALARADASDSIACRLDDRELTVLRRLVEGKLNKQIAAELSLSERTVKSCRALLMRKLGVDSFSALVRQGQFLVEE